MTGSCRARSRRSVRAQSRCPRRIPPFRRLSRRCRRRAAWPRRRKRGRWAARSRGWNSRCPNRGATRRPSACSSVAARSAPSTRSMHAVRPSSVNDTSSGCSPMATSASPGRMTLRRRNSIASMSSASAKLAHRRFDGEGGLRHAVAAQRTAGHRVGVHRVAVELLVGATVLHHGGSAGEQRLAAVVTVCAGVGHVAEVHRCQRAVGFGAESHGDLHRMPR